MKRLSEIVDAQDKAKGIIADADQRTPRQRADAVQEQLNTLYQMAGAEDAPQEVVNVLDKIGAETEALVKANRQLEDKLVKVMMAEAIMRTQRDEAKLDQEHLRKHAVERGMREISTRLGLDIDMNPNAVRRVLAAVIGEKTDMPKMDIIPPYYIAQLREAIDEIERLIFEHDMYVADADE